MTLPAVFFPCSAELEVKVMTKQTERKQVHPNKQLSTSSALLKEMGLHRHLGPTYSAANSTIYGTSR